MARINIESSLFSDFRYQKFVGLVACPTFALGAWVQAATVAQKYWCDLKNLHAPIPESAWNDAGLHPKLIESGLVVKVEKGYYLRGSEEHFQWLINLKLRARNGGQAKLSPRLAPAKPLTLTPSPTLKNTHTSKSSDMKLHALAELWNEHCGQLPKVKGWSSARQKKALRLWALAPSEPHAYFTDVIQKIARSKFCNGDGKTGWRASIDWLLRPDTHVKVLEGVYDDRAQPQAPVRLLSLKDLENL